MLMKSVTAFLISALIGACVACGTQDSTDIPDEEVQKPSLTGPVIDKSLRSYVRQFLNDCEVRRTDCEARLSLLEEIKVVDIPDEKPNDDEVVVGLCYSNFFQKKVHINSLALKFSGRYMQALVYHELGHCMYGLDHEKKPDMLMSEMMPSLLVLVRDWDELLADFFAAIEEENGP